MDLLLLIKGIIIGLSASIPLGPVGLVCIQKTLNSKTRNGVIAGAGAAMADTFFAVVAAFGISAVHNFIETQQLFLRLAGGIILLFLGLKFFLTNPAIQIRKQRNKTNNLWADFVSVFLLTLSNPITVVVFGAVFAGFGIIPKESSWFDMIMLVSGVFSGAMLWWISLVYIINMFRKKFRLRRLWWMNKIMGVVITLFGLFALVSAFFLEF
ncbi:MAG TPA: LysE family transporter [Bacteroidales bacterium]|nr:LysE family transporter [Bacteroidales bacterium]